MSWYNNVDDTYDDMHSLGAILAEAIKRRDQMHIVVNQSRKTVVSTTTFAVPQWLEHAFKGEKIQAIKALREIVGREQEGKHINGRYVGGCWRLGLKEAKDIVENITNNLKTGTDEV